MAERDQRSSAARSAALASLELEQPLRELARPQVDEWAVRRMWEGVQRRRASPAQSERRHVALLAAFAALASVLALVVAGAQLVVSAYSPAEGAPATSARVAGAPPRSAAVAAEPLLTSEARRFELLEAPPLEPANDASPAAASPATRSRTRTARVDFADGSSIEASPGARVEALASKPGEFAVALRRGRAQFRVTPGGPRRWRIEAGHAEVEVLGTVLWVERDGAGTSVRVDIGRVLVRAPELPGGSQPVAAGEVLRLGGPPEARAPEAPSSELEPSPGATAAAVERPRQRAPASLGATRRARAAGAAAPSRAGRATAAAALWEQADEARRRGDPARAAALLARLVEHFPEDSQVALAAFTLGVLQLDRLARPLEAAESFQLALELGLGAALRDDAYLRWAEALDQARDPVRLSKVRAEYARLYPRGRHREAIERLARPAAGAASRRRAPDGAAPSDRSP